MNFFFHRSESFGYTLNGSPIKPCWVAMIRSSDFYKENEIDKWLANMSKVRLEGQFIFFDNDTDAI